MQASARTLVQQLDAAQSISNRSSAPAMPFGLAVDGKKLMSRFFQLLGGWVQEVASAAAAVVTDAEIQADVKVIGRAYALVEHSQAAHGPPISAAAHPGRKCEVSTHCRLTSRESVPIPGSRPGVVSLD